MLKLRYPSRRRSRCTPTQACPTGLVLKGGIWYLVALSGKSVRTYRVANIHDAQMCDEVFARQEI